MTFLRNLKAPAGMTLVVRGFCPKTFLQDIIFEKFKGPCGHDTGRSGLLPQLFVCRMSFSWKFKVVRGVCPKSLLPDVIVDKFKGPCGHDTGRSGLLPQNIFAGSHLLSKQQHYFFVFQETYPKVSFSMLFGHIYFSIVQSEFSGGSIILTRRGGVG